MNMPYDMPSDNCCSVMHLLSLAQYFDSAVELELVRGFRPARSLCVSFHNMTLLDSVEKHWLCRVPGLPGRNLKDAKTLKYEGTRNLQQESQEFDVATFISDGTRGVHGS